MRNRDKSTALHVTLNLLNLDWIVGLVTVTTQMETKCFMVQKC